MRKFSSAGAKNHFGVLIDAARIAPVAVTKYDKPFVVVMAVEEFKRMKRPFGNGASVAEASPKAPFKEP